MGKLNVKRQSFDIQAMFSDKMVPRDIEMERAVLGAIMLERNAIFEVYEFLVPACFYNDAHNIIYSAIKDLFDHNNTPNILTVTDWLRGRNLLDKVGGPFYITQCTNDVVSSANLQAHALVIVQKFIAREFVRNQLESAIDVYEDNGSAIWDKIDKFNEKIFALSNPFSQVKPVDLPHISIKAMKQTRAGMEEGGLVGIPFGIKCLDSKKIRILPGNVAVLAARTRHGKSAVALALLESIAYEYSNDYPGCFSSMEMVDIECFYRVQSGFLRRKGIKIPYSKLQKGDITQEELSLVEMHLEELVNLKLYIDDEAALNTQNLKVRLRRMKEKYGCKISYIDYVQLLRTANKKGSKTEDLDQVMTDLKEMAKSLDMAIVVLAQVKQDNEKGEPAAPGLTDVKWADAIGEKVDFFMSIFRPEVHNKYAIDEFGASLQNKMFFRLLKARQDEPFEEYIPFDVRYNSFFVDDDNTESLRDYLKNAPLNPRPIN